MRAITDTVEAAKILVLAILTIPVGIIIFLEWCFPLRRQADHCNCAVSQIHYFWVMKEAVRARVEQSLKAEAESVFECLGISTTEAIRMFLTQVKMRRGLPFAVEIPSDSAILRSATARQAALDTCYDD